MQSLSIATEIVRAWAEGMWFSALSHVLEGMCDCGDGHPVMVIPGYGANDTNTAAIRRFLTNVGYTALPWQRGTNLGVIGDMDTYIQGLSQQFVHDAGGVPYSIIGWSLGGIYAREVAKISHTTVRQVVTLGTPAHCDPHSASAQGLCALLTRGAKRADPVLLRTIAVAPDVPCTSIYSTCDGVVPWRYTMIEESATHENIRIQHASHLGMCNNLMAAMAMCDRLSQPVGAWARCAH